jgi:peptide/nickel transport system permease protein
LAGPLAVSLASDAGVEATMTRFIIRRLIQSCFLLIGISIAAFVLLHIAPGGPTAFAEDPRLPKEYAQQQRHDFGLDQPLPVQYGKWLWQMLHLNFGRSLQDRRPVIDKIKEKIPATMELSGAALLLGLLGIPLGVVAALRRGGWFDHGLRIFTVLGNSVPTWWLGLLILTVSVKTVHWFPIAGTYTPGKDGVLDRLHHLLLPAVLLSITGWLALSRFMRSEFLEVIGQDYVRTARAKGLSEGTVIWRHALRNALIVVITILGSSLAVLISGAVLFERVFSWPGIGRLSVDSAFERDYPVLMALVVITASLVIIGNLLADIAYGFVDPRIKYS